MTTKKTIETTLNGQARIAYLKAAERGQIANAKINAAANALGFGKNAIIPLVGSWGTLIQEYIIAFHEWLAVPVHHRGTALIGIWCGEYTRVDGTREKNYPLPSLYGDSLTLSDQSKEIRAEVWRDWAKDRGLDLTMITKENIDSPDIWKAVAIYGI